MLYYCFWPVTPPQKKKKSYMYKIPCLSQSIGKKIGTCQHIDSVGVLYRVTEFYHLLILPAHTNQVPHSFVCFLGKNS